LDKKWPKRGELLVVKIKRIMDYGAVADILEYEDKEGFIHISNVTKSWVKNIRSHVSKGETRVAEVLNVDQDKNSINLSLKDVSDTQIRRKMNIWRRTKRTRKVLDKLLEEMNKEPKEGKEEVLEKLIITYGDPFVVFEELSTYGEETLEQLDISKGWKDKLIEFAKKNVAPKKVTIEGELNVKLETGNSLETVKKALQKIDKQENTKLEYISAPKYKLMIEAKDYKEAEEKITQITEELKEKIEKEGGQVTFKKKGR